MANLAILHFDLIDIAQSLICKRMATNGINERCALLIATEAGDADEVNRLLRQGAYVECNPRKCLGVIIDCCI